MKMFLGTKRRPISIISLIPPGTCVLWPLKFSKFWFCTDFRIFHFFSFWLCIDLLDFRYINFFKGSRTISFIICLLLLETLEVLEMKFFSQWIMLTIDQSPQMILNCVKILLRNILNVLKACMFLQITAAFH